MLVKMLWYFWFADAMLVVVAVVVQVHLVDVLQAVVLHHT